MLSDVRIGSAGNIEREGYLYDTRMAMCNGLAAGVPPPRAQAAMLGNKKGDFELTFPGEWPLRGMPRDKSGDQKDDSEIDFVWWRAPFVASFSAGDFDFTLLIARMRWANSLEQGATVCRDLAEWIDELQQSEPVFGKDIIVMADFFIPKVGDELYKAITSKGLQMPAALEGVPFTSVAGTPNYDQILHYSYGGKSFTENGGILDFYQGDHEVLFPGLSRKAFTFQLSDHFPLWVQLDSDIEGIDLDRVIQAGDE